MLVNGYRWFPGWVQVELEGGYPQRFLNDVTAASVPVWQVRWRSDRVRFCCLAADYRGLHPMARRACLRMRVRQKHGLPFWRHRYRHRKGLVVGLVLYALVLTLLAPRIWVVEVSGNTATSTASIRQAVESRGVYVGAKTKDLDVKGLQMYGTNDLPTLSFITVNPNGCVARVEVREREQPPSVLELSQPSDLVAVCDGLVLDMEIRSGQPLVKKGEAVTAGTRLVTGAVETEMGEKLYRSYGAVWAQTQRKITVEVPLSDTRLIPTGEPVCRPGITFLCWVFPLYSKTPLQAKTTHRQTCWMLTVGGTELPLGLVTDYYQPLTTFRFARTQQAAQKVALERLQEQERELFPSGGYDRITETGRMLGDRYVLTATYLCRENIAVEVPLGGFLSGQNPENAALEDTAPKN